MQQKFTLLFFMLLMSIAGLNAQTVATFDNLSLPKPDTFYVNYSNYGNDVGFDDGLAHFPCVYDTSFGYEFWSSGFAYSNMNDSLTPGFGNQYAAIAGKGFNNSNQYVVAYGESNKVLLKGKAQGHPVNGCYVTNSTYAYYSMKDGDMFAKKFGGTSGNDSDWFKLTIKGYTGGQLTTDSVDFYLADFRFQNNANDTILNGWQWINLLPLGEVDSLLFTLSSSDTGMFGMNTPAYFCMDQFITYETEKDVVKNVPSLLAAKVYPNPATDRLHIEAADGRLTEIAIVDATGKMVLNQKVVDKVTSLNVSGLMPGVYMLQLRGEGQTGSMRFVKQ